MKNENVHMQALHCKLYVVLVQILPYNNCSETYYSFCEDSLLSRTPPSTRMRCGFHHQTPSAPSHYFFSLRRPCQSSYSYCKFSVVGCKAALKRSISESLRRISFTRWRIRASYSSCRDICRMNIHTQVLKPS